MAALYDRSGLERAPGMPRGVAHLISVAIFDSLLIVTGHETAKAVREQADETIARKPEYHAHRYTRWEKRIHSLPKAQRP